MVILYIPQLLVGVVQGPQYKQSNKTHSINKELPCKANVVIVNVLVPPHELMPATDTLYSALGAKS